MTRVDEIEGRLKARNEVLYPPLRSTKRLRDVLLRRIARFGNGRVEIHTAVLEAVTNDAAYADDVAYLLAEVGRLDAEAERHLSSYKIAHDQAVSNGAEVKRWRGQFDEVEADFIRESQERQSLERIAMSLAEALERALEWIDAVPSDTVAILPAMPGFDRDEVDNLISDQRLAKIGGK